MQQNPVSLGRLELTRHATKDRIHALANSDRRWSNLAWPVATMSTETVGAASYRWSRQAVSRHVAIMAIAVMFSPMTALVAAQSAANPLVGRWELNVARTHYGGGAEPRVRESLICRAAGVATTCTTTSLRPDGRTVVGTFTARDDGTPAPVQGVQEMDELSLTRIDSAIVDATFKYRGQPVFAYRAVRASNGRSLTIISVDPVTRAALHSVVVYDAR